MVLKVLPELKALKDLREKSKLAQKFSPLDFGIDAEFAMTPDGSDARKVNQTSLNQIEEDDEYNPLFESTLNGSSLKKVPSQGLGSSVRTHSNAESTDGALIRQSQTAAFLNVSADE